VIETLRASIITDFKTAESQVEEREAKRKRKAGVPLVAGSSECVVHWLWANI
jgi:hypothetical protein